jgi:signal transduction histidine kinase
MIVKPLQPDTRDNPAHIAPNPAQPPTQTTRRFVALRSKTLALLMLTMIGLLIALYIPLRLIVLGSFLDLETQTTRTEVVRAKNALDTAIAKLDGSANDYATWDDTYAFVQDGNSDYLEVNLADPSFLAGDINLIVIVNNSGQIVGAKAYDLDQQRSIPVPAFFRESSTIRSALFQQNILDSATTGLALLPEGPMLVASRPIVTSENQGPIRGALLMGRYLDPALIDRLSEATHLNLTFFRPNDPQRPTETQALHTFDTIMTQPLSANSIAGMILLPDVVGQPGLILRAETPRDIYAQGVTTVTYFTIALIVVALASLIVSLLGLERMVLARVARLDARAHAIGEIGDVSLRMEPLGNDELTRLSLSINSMLTALEHAQITRAQAEEARAQSQEELLRSREQWSQMLVHDLKNPLTATKGYLDLLNHTDLDQDQQELIAGVHRSTSNTLALVTQLLDIARMTEGRLELYIEEVALEALLESCARELRSWADMEQKTIIVSIPPACPPLTADESLLRRVLLNLISNAIKHTPPSTAITLGIELADTHIRIFVHDTGPGMPTAIRLQLFQRFATTAGTSQHQTNTGLGLAFCKLAIKAHGGTISLDSASGQGTRFTITLPL